MTFTNGNASFFRYPRPKEPLKGLLLEEMNITPVDTVTENQEQVILHSRDGSLHRQRSQQGRHRRRRSDMLPYLSYEIRIGISRYVARLTEPCSWEGNLDLEWRGIKIIAIVTIVGKIKLSSDRTYELHGYSRIKIVIA